MSVVGENAFGTPAKVAADREMRHVREELQKLRESNEQLKSEITDLISNRLEDADEEVRRMYENVQSQMYEERNKKDEQIRQLFDTIDGHLNGKDQNVDILQNDNSDLRNRVDFLEKEIDSKTEFIQKQTNEQESDRQALEDQVQMLQLALDKIKDKHKVRTLSTVSLSFLTTFQRKNCEIWPKMENFDFCSKL